MTWLKAGARPAQNVALSHHWYQRLGCNRFAERWDCNIKNISTQHI